jgi:hypothetical protein
VALPQDQLLAAVLLLSETGEGRLRGDDANLLEQLLLLEVVDAL